jgi:hypothetical protein
VATASLHTTATWEVAAYLHPDLASHLRQPVSVSLGRAVATASLHTTATWEVAAYLHPDLASHLRQPVSVWAELSGVFERGVHAVRRGPGRPVDDADDAQRVHAQDQGQNPHREQRLPPQKGPGDRPRVEPPRPSRPLTCPHLRQGHHSAPLPPGAIASAY